MTSTRVGALYIMLATAVQVNCCNLVAYLLASFMVGVAREKCTCMEEKDILFCLFNVHETESSQLDSVCAGTA